MSDKTKFKELVMNQMFWFQDEFYMKNSKVSAIQLSAHFLDHTVRDIPAFAEVEVMPSRTLRMIVKRQVKRMQADDRLGCN